MIWSDESMGGSILICVSMMNNRWNSVKLHQNFSYPLRKQISTHLRPSQLPLQSMLLNIQFNFKSIPKHNHRFLFTFVSQSEPVSHDARDSQKSRHNTILNHMSRKSINIKTDADLDENSSL